MPFIVSVYFGRFITQSMNRDYANEIAYLEWAELQAPVESAKPIESIGDTVDQAQPTKSYASVAKKVLETKPKGASGDFASPQGGAALPLTFTPRSLPVVVVGSSRLAASRAFTFIEADADVVVVSSVPLEQAHEEIQFRVKKSQVRYLQLQLDDLLSWAKWLSANDVALLCVTDTLIGSANRRTLQSAEIISKACISLHIPVNVSDQPTLSTFSFPAVHRFQSADKQLSNLQIAVSTNGHGCRLSARIKREIITKLPADVAAAVDNVGALRRRAIEKTQTRLRISEDDPDTSLNSPVPQLDTSSLLNGASKQLGHAMESSNEKQLRRMRWVHQMSEYYSYSALAKLTTEDMEAALDTYSTTTTPALPHHELALKSIDKGGAKKGSIYLVGSGPGHPGLLTMAAHQALTHATIILSDKLVPSEILALIPSTTKLHIAKKFPGNAEGAQNEMMALALEGAQNGEVVVRLKQGDPFVYGRGGEEVLFFREHGFEAIVVPGVSSALAGPLMMGIPVTQRGVAESLILCTGVGRQGKAVQLPGYVKSRTLVILMGVARINQIISTLTDITSAGRDGSVYPKHTPIAIIERASSPDQRIVASTLENVEEALKRVGEERPPGMMVVGWSVLCLEKKGRVDILDLDTDGDENGKAEEGIVKGWLGDGRWKVREGLGGGWELLDGLRT